MVEAAVALPPNCADRFHETTTRYPMKGSVSASSSNQASTSRKELRCTSSAPIIIFIAILIVSNDSHSFLKLNVKAPLPVRTDQVAIDYLFKA